MPRKRPASMPATDLARRLDAAAAQSGLTNEAIAESVGTTPGNVSHWRLGRHAPDWEQIQRLARLFGASDFELLTGRPEPANLEAKFRGSLETLRQGVEAGADPAAAYEQALETLGAFEAADQELMDACRTGLRRFLATPDGREWLALRPDQAAVVREVMRAMAQAAREELRARLAAPPDPEPPAADPGAPDQE